MAPAIPPSTGPTKDWGNAGVVGGDVEPVVGEVSELEVGGVVMGGVVVGGTVVIEAVVGETVIEAVVGKVVVGGTVVGGTLGLGVGVVLTSGVGKS